MVWEEHCQTKNECQIFYPHHRFILPCVQTIIMHFENKYSTWYFKITMLICWEHVVVSIFLGRIKVNSSGRRKWGLNFVINSMTLYSPRFPPLFEQQSQSKEKRSNTIIPEHHEVIQKPWKASNQVILRNTSFTFIYSEINFV